MIHRSPGSSGPPRQRGRFRAALLLVALLAPLVPPLADALHADVAMCCRDRCCCASESVDPDTTCMRAACRCGDDGSPAITSPVRVAAVLPRGDALAGPGVRPDAEMPTDASPLAGFGEPPRHPPRPALPA